MAHGEVKNYYVVTILGSNQSVVIPDSWIRARVGGAILFYLPPQDHYILAQIGGPFSISWSSKYGQIEQGFDNYLEASNYMNNTPTQASPEIQNFEREAPRQINENKTENKNITELETLLRANTHLQLKPRKKQETSLKYSTNPGMSLKESNELAALLRNPEIPPAKTSSKPQPKPLLSKEPAERSQFGDRRQNIMNFSNGKVIESAVLVQLQPEPTKNKEQAKNKGLPDLVPIKSLRPMKMQTVVNPVQIARVAPMETSAVKTSVIVRNKTVDTKSDPVFPQPCVANVSREFEEQEKQMDIQSKLDSTSEESSSTRPEQSDPGDNNIKKMQVIGTQQMGIDNKMPAKLKKLTQKLTRVVDKTSPLYGISSDASEHLDKKESADTIAHSSLDENCEHTLSDISLKSNLSLFKIKLPITTKEKCNITSQKQLCGKSSKKNDKETQQQCKDNTFTVVHNKEINKKTKKLMTTTEQASTSAEISDFTPLCASVLIQKQVYSRSKKNRLESMLKNLENSLNIFENLKMLRSSMSVSIKDKLRIIKETREIIDKSLTLAKTSSKRRVIKPSPSIDLHKSPKKIIKDRMNSMDTEDKWTLNYKRQEKGTVELMSNSHIYVNKKRLASCIKYACDYRHLGRLLLHEIFTEHALNKCSMTKGKTARPGGYRRPGLNEAGIKALCDYVETYKPTPRDGKLYRNWRPVVRKLLKKSIANYLSKNRRY